MLILFATCRKLHVVSEGQKVLFQYDYINYSTDYQHNGFFIDNAGNVLTYNKPDKWNFPDHTETLTQQEIEENLSSCTPAGFRIPETELQKFVNYINNLAASKVSARRTRTRSSKAGIASFYCFQYSENEAEYKVVTVKSEGEVECENLNFYSKRVVEWMKDINSTLMK